MKVQKLADILNRIKGVEINTWNIVPTIIELVNEPTFIHEGQWADEAMNEDKDIFPLNIKDISTWSTYDNCIDARFYMENDKFLWLYAKVYEGHTFTGGRTFLRFTLRGALPYSALKKIEPHILAELNCYLEREYQNELERRKKEWIGNLRNQILKG